jgi:hypothetical protein
MDKKKQLLIQQLKRQIIIWAVIFSLILGAIAYSKKNFTDAVAQKSNEENNIMNMKVDLAALQNKIKSINEQLKLWDTINNKTHKRQGLEIDKFKTIILDLQSHYNLNNKVNVNITSPSELTDTYREKTTVIESSTITLTINATSDLVILAFVDALTKNIPGFLHYQSLVINRNLDLTNEIIIDASKGIEDTLVQATVVLVWRDFKDL